MCFSWLSSSPMGDRLALVRIYLESLFAKLDECVSNIVWSLGGVMLSLMSIPAFFRYSGGSVPGLGPSAYWGLCSPGWMNASPISFARWAAMMFSLDRHQLSSDILVGAFRGSCTQAN